MEQLSLMEHNSDSYGPRTYFNAGFTDLTVAFAVNFNTAGEILTEKASKGKIVQIEVTKEFEPIKASRQIFKVMKYYNARSLNIAGNGMYTFKVYDISQEQLNEWVYHTLVPLHKHLCITKIRSGGQTGADLAGVVTGVLLGIETLVTFPKGYRQRLEDGMDVIQSKEEALDTITRYVERLKNKLDSENKQE